MISRSERGDDPVGPQAVDEIGQPAPSAQAGEAGARLRAVGGRHQAAPSASCPVAAATIVSSDASCVRELGDEPALAHDEDPVGDAEHLGQLGRDHQDRHALAGQLVEQPVHLRLRGDVDAARRLVDEQERRLGGRATWRARPSAGSRPRARWPGWPELPVLELEPRAPVGGEAALRGRQDEPEAPEPPERRERDVARDRHLHDEPLLAAILRHEADAGGHRRRRRGLAQLLRPLTVTEPGVVAVDPEDRAGDLAAAGADEPGERDDLARLHLERHVGEEPLAGKALDLQHGRAGRLAGLRLPLDELAADHGAHEVVGGEALEAAADHPAPVAQHRDLADRAAKISSRRCEMKSTAAPAARRLVDDAEQPLDLDRRQRRGRLVHDDDLGVERQGLADLDDLLLGDRQPARDSAPDRGARRGARRPP